MSSEKSNTKTPEFAKLTEPIVIFYGPVEVGKSLAALRLYRYLRFDNPSNVNIAIDESLVKNNSFYDNQKREYEEIIKALESDTILAPKSTGVASPMLFTITEHSTTICHILETSGEIIHRSNTALNDEEKDFIEYFNRLFFDDLIRNTLPKIWVFFFELDMFNGNSNTQEKWASYIGGIEKLLNDQRYPQKNRILFLITKCDKKRHKPGFFHNSKHIERAFIKQIEVKKEFAQLKEFLKLKKLKYQYLVFSSAEVKEAENRKPFKWSDNNYPKKLWETINSQLRGGNIISSYRASQLLKITLPVIIGIAAIIQFFEQFNQYVITPIINLFIH